MSRFIVNRLFPIPLIHIKFEKHNNYKFNYFPKKEKIPKNWTQPLYTSFPSIQSDDEFMSESIINSLKDDLKQCIDKVFTELRIPTNWKFREFWYNYYYGEQGQERHTHLTCVGYKNIYWSGIYYNMNPTPTMFYRNDPFASISNYNESDNSELREFYYEKWCPFVEEGDIILFPPYLEHSVPPTNNNERMRLTFSFNMDLQV